MPVLYRINTCSISERIGLTLNFIGELSSGKFFISPIPNRLSDKLLVDVKTYQY